MPGDSFRPSFRLGERSADTLDRMVLPPVGGAAAAAAAAAPGTVRRSSLKRSSLKKSSLKRNGSDRTARTSTVRISENVRVTEVVEEIESDESDSWMDGLTGSMRPSSDAWVHPDLAISDESDSADSADGQVYHFAKLFNNMREIHEMVDKRALAVRHHEGFEATNSFWFTYNGANLAALMNITWDGEIGIPSSEVPAIRRALLTQPLYVHYLDVEGPFRQEGSAEAQVVNSVIKMYTKNPAGFLWYRLVGVLRAKDQRHKALAMRITAELLRVGRSTKHWQLAYHMTRARIEGQGLFGLKRSFTRIVAIALIRFRLQGVASKVTAILSHDLLEMLRVDDAAGQAAANLLKTLIQQPPACQSLIAAGALLKLNYLARTSRLGAEMALRLKIAILSQNGEMYHWIMYQIDADERRSAVHPEDKKKLILSAALLVTIRQDLNDLHHHKLQDHVIELLVSTDQQFRLYGASVLTALQSLWKRAKRTEVLKLSCAQLRSSTIESALKEGGKVTNAIANLGPDTMHLVQLRDSCEELVKRIEPLCVWENLVEMFKIKYKPKTPPPQPKDMGHTKNKGRSKAAAARAPPPRKAGGAEADLDVVLTRSRAEIAAAMFVEVKEALRSEITSDTQLSAQTLENIELFFFACKAVSAAAFEAIKHFLSIAVPKKSLPRVIEVLHTTQLDHSSNDLERVLTEELLRMVDMVVGEAPLPTVVAEKVYTLAYMGAVQGKIANSTPAKRKSVEKIW